MDWRLHPQLENYFIRTGEGCDLCVTAGSITGLLDLSTQGYFLSQIELSKKLHHCQAVILTMHLDCGAYGGSESFPNRDAENAHHRELLSQAAAVIAKAFPGTLVERYIVSLEESGGEWNAIPQAIS